MRDAQAKVSAASQAVGSIVPPEAVSNTTAMDRYEIVTVRFLSNTLGTRMFPLPSKNKYKFDAGVNRERRMPGYDAAELLKRNPGVFEIVKG